MNDAVFRSISRVCRAGLDSVTLRREVVSRVARLVPFDAYAFSTCDPDTGLMAHTIAEGIPAALAKAYVEWLYPEECARLSMDLPRRGATVFSMSEHSREAEAEFGAAGMRIQLHASLAANGRLWGSWCLLRSSGSVGVTERDRRFLERVTPHVTRGLQSAALVDRGLAAAAAPADRRATEATPGILVLDAGYRPVVRTPLATVWLEDLADVGLRMPHGLPLSVFGLVVRLRTTRVGVAPEEARLRVRGASGRWYVMRASLAEPDATGECAAVVVVRPALPREVATILTRLYDLSDREREVIAAIARGDSTKAIAAALGVSPHTVAEHVERACRKIGVRGRKALVAKLFVDGYAPRSPLGKPAATATR
jgi:DNA-binding CsgD family transcriptional regulator